MNSHKIVIVKNILFVILSALLISLFIHGYWDTFISECQLIFVDKTKTIFSSSEFSTYTFKILLFASITAILSAIYAVIEIFKPNLKYPFFLKMLHLISFSYCMLMFTCALVSMPYQMTNGNNFVQAFELAFGGFCLHSHLIIPVGFSILFLLCFKFEKINKKIYFFTFIPLVCWILEYCLCVFVFKNWYDFYNIQITIDRITIFGAIGLLTLMFAVLFALDLLFVFIHKHKISEKNKADSKAYNRL